MKDKCCYLVDVMVGRGHGLVQAAKLINKLQPLGRGLLYIFIMASFGPD